MSEGILSGMTGVVFGVANKRSIAWAIAKAWHKAGAKLIFNYQGERLKENVQELVTDFGDDVPLYPCDVTRDEEIDAFFSKVAERSPKLDLLLHAVAFAPKEALEGDFISTTREALRVAHDVSAYSLVALAQRAAPMMTDGGSIVAMTSTAPSRWFLTITSWAWRKHRWKPRRVTLPTTSGRENPCQLYQRGTGANAGGPRHFGFQPHAQAL